MIGHLNKNTPKQRQKVYGRSELQKCVKNIIKSGLFCGYYFILYKEKMLPIGIETKLKVELKPSLLYI